MMNAKRLFFFFLLFCPLSTVVSGQPVARRGNPLLVISVDGMDYRYLRDADRLGLKIPHLRRLMREGELTAGVTGVFPTVTWPSHTTMITGVTPAAHGILGNRRPASEGGDYYWNVSLLKTKTLWHAARAAGLKTAAITWPVTVDADIDFNLPEYFQGRNGGAMDLKSIAAKATPGLVDKIARAYPSFTTEWMNDRTRAQATMYLLRYERPDLILLHLVDLDAEAHHNGPFTREANAVLEYTDELIGQILAVTPKNMTVAVVSDHGFERIDKVVDLSQAMAGEGVRGALEMRSGYVLTRDAGVAQWLRAMQAAGKYGVGREIPVAEAQTFTTDLAGATVFESAEHFLFGAAPKGELYTKPTETGVHGLWPGRPDYAASMVIRGQGIRPGRAPRASMLTMAARFATILGIDMPR